MLDDGNKYAANKFKSQHGLKQVASAFGIIGECVGGGGATVTHTYTHFAGFLHFLEGYYIVLITKRKQ